MILLSLSLEEIGRKRWKFEIPKNIVLGDLLLPFK